MRVSFSCVSKQINQIDCRFGRAYVMMRFVDFHLFPASDASEPIVAGIGVSEAYFGFEVPMSVEYPCVAVGYSRADEPTLVAGFFQFAGVRSQEMEPSVESAHVIQTSMKMYAKKVTGEPVAEPITRLGLHNLVLPSPAVRKRPAVEFAREVERPSGGETGFYSEADIHESIGKQIGLYCSMLCLNPLRKAEHSDSQQ